MIVLMGIFDGAGGRQYHIHLFPVFKPFSLLRLPARSHIDGGGSESENEGFPTYRFQV